MYVVCVPCVYMVCVHGVSAVVLPCVYVVCVPCVYCMPSVLRTCLMNNNANYTVGVQTVNLVM